MRNQFFLTAILTSIVFAFLPSIPAHADYYSCPKMVYAKGWIRKYEYKGESWAADTKKGGPFSSTTQTSIEQTTASVDPGVTTGYSVSSTQMSSSFGECAAFDMMIAKNFRNDYIEQNLHEIKKQIALGAGYHLDSLAVLSGCENSGVSWNRVLQSHTADFYDAKDGASFGTTLDNVINGSPELRKSCGPPNA